jgi:hypothetical protein
LLTHPSTRGALTLTQAREAFAAFVDSYVGFDSATAVEHAKAILTDEVWADHAVPTEAALTSLHNISHQPLDLDVDAVADMTEESRDYVIGHLLGLFAALDSGMFTGMNATTVALLASAMYRSPAGRAQLLAFAQAHADASPWSDETTVGTVYLLDATGEQVRDQFGSPEVITRGSFQRIWFPILAEQAAQERQARR